MYFSHWRELQSGTQSTLPVMLFSLFAFLIQVTSLLNVCIWDHGLRSSSDTSAVTSLLEQKGENLKILFLCSDSVPSTFVLLAISPCVILTPGHIKLSEFYSGIPQQTEGPYVCADLSDTKPRPIHHSMGEDKAGEVSTFSSVRLSLISVNDQRLIRHTPYPAAQYPKLFHFGSVALICYSETW